MRTNTMVMPAFAQSATEFSAPPKDSAVYEPHARVLTHGLSAEHLTEFRAKGYVVVRGAFSEIETAAWSRACDEVLARTDLVLPGNLRFEQHPDPVTGRMHVWKIDPFLDVHPVLGALTRDRRLLDPLCSIYGGREPRLFKDKLIYKPPGGHGSGLHQDYNWWQGFPTSLISVLVAVDSANRENGCTELFPGYEQGFLHTPGSFKHLPKERVPMEKGEFVETRPGDLAFFHCFAPHQAAANTSALWRRQIFLTYNDSADGEHYQAHRDHYLWYVTREKAQDEIARSFFL